MAIQKNSQKLCREIRDQEKQQECLATLLVMWGIKEDKLEICESISIPHIQAICTQRIYEKRAKTASDKSFCVSISGEAQQQCKNSVDEENLKKILSSGNITEAECAKLELVHQDTCYKSLKRAQSSQALKMAIASDKVDACQNITADLEKNLCTDTVYLKNAISLNDSSFCGKILDTTKKKYCDSTLKKASESKLYRDIIASGDRKQCKQLSQLPLQLKCQEIIIFTLVRTTRDIQHCRELSSTGLISSCQALIQ